MVIEEWAPVAALAYAADGEVLAPATRAGGLDGNEKGHAPPPSGGGALRHTGRTTPRISIEPAPARVTFRPGRGACTIAPFPTYMPMWLASLK